MRKISNWSGMLFLSIVLVFTLAGTVSAEAVYGENVIPIMTSTTTPSGIVASSSQYSGTPGWRAFDGKTNYALPGDGFGAWGTPQTSGWVSYEFPASKQINKYILHSGLVGEQYSPAGAPKAWTFQASNDGSNWVTLDTKTNITDWATGKLEVEFSNNNAYKIYKLDITQNNGQAGYIVNMYVSELEMMEKIADLPATPTNLTATSGNSQVNLSWGTVDGAASYNLQRSLTEGGPYTVIYNIYSATYTDLDVVNGTTYYYVVTAVNEDGESNLSNEAAATPQAEAPAAPTSLNVTAGDSSVTLSWESVNNVTSYNIKRATVSGGPYESVTSVTYSTTSFMDETVVNGLTYYYVISAVNAGGESPDSNEASATPLAPAPEDNTRALLTLYLTGGQVKEYDVSAAELADFLSWFDDRAEGVGAERYGFDKNWNEGPFKARTEYVIFSKIDTFDIDEYEAEE